MGQLPPARVDEQELVQRLRELQAGDNGQAATYLAPRTLPALLQARADHPKAQLVAGCTDVGLWVTKLHQRYEQVLDVTRCDDLRRIEHAGNKLAIGAAVTLQDAFDALAAERPQLKTFANRFAGLPVRNSGTLGGNIANGSPIGDSMPLLIALGATIVLASVRGERELPLEAFYTGYRRNVLAPDEVLARIQVPRPTASEQLRAYKVSKRFDDDISAVCLAVALQVDAAGAVTHARIGAGGVAATPARAVKTEAALLGQPWNDNTARQAAATLRAEFQPISDMRASAAYRSTVLGNLVRRFWLDTQGLQTIQIENLASLEALA